MMYDKGMRDAGEIGEFLKRKPKVNRNEKIRPVSSRYSRADFLRLYTFLLSTFLEIGETTQRSCVRCVFTRHID